MMSVKLSRKIGNDLETIVAHGVDEIPAESGLRDNALTSARNALISA